jgi:hypothetical protein
VDVVEPDVGPAELRRGHLSLRPTVRGVALGGAAVAVSLLLATWSSLTVGAYVVVGGVGAALVAVAMSRPLVPASARLPVRRWLPWLLLALALALWELALLLLGNNDSWPPLSLLADPIDRVGAGRFSLALLWVAAGWWLVRRLRR